MRGVTDLGRRAARSTTRETAGICSSNAGAVLHPAQASCTPGAQGAQQPGKSASASHIEAVVPDPSVRIAHRREPPHKIGTLVPLRPAFGAAACRTPTLVFRPGPATPPRTDTPGEPRQPRAGGRGSGAQLFPWCSRPRRDGDGGPAATATPRTAARQRTHGRTFPARAPPPPPLSQAQQPRRSAAPDPREHTAMRPPRGRGFGGRDGGRGFGGRDGGRGGRGGFGECPRRAAPAARRGAAPPQRSTLHALHTGPRTPPSRPCVCGTAGRPSPPACPAVLTAGPIPLGNAGGRGGGFGGRGGGRGGWQDQGPPESVIEAGTFSHACEGEAVCKLTNDKVGGGGRVRPGRCGAWRPSSAAIIIIPRLTQLGAPPRPKGPWLLARATAYAPECMRSHACGVARSQQGVGCKGGAQLRAQHPWRWRRPCKPPHLPTPLRAGSLLQRPHFLRK